jgi:hypothetical protein
MDSILSAGQAAFPYADNIVTLGCGIVNVVIQEASQIFTNANRCCESFRYHGAILTTHDPFAGMLTERPWLASS